MSDQEQTCHECGSEAPSRHCSMDYCKRHCEKAGHEEQTVRIDLEKLDALVGVALANMILSECKR